MRNRHHPVPRGSDLVITSRASDAVITHNFHNRWKSASNRAGTPALHFHDLRDFYVSALAWSGQHDPKTIQALARHLRFEHTWNFYASLVPP